MICPCKKCSTPILSHIIWFNPGSCRKMQFLSFFGAPTSKNNEKLILWIINFCISSTFLRDFYRVRKIDWTFDLSLILLGSMVYMAICMHTSLLDMSTP
jgi:hypothetical protein